MGESIWFLIYTVFASEKAGLLGLGFSLQQGLLTLSLSGGMWRTGSFTDRTGEGDGEGVGEGEGADHQP